MSDLTCPSCGGTKQIYRIVHYSDRPAAFGYVPCEACGATGLITQAAMARVDEGERLRADRIARRVSLRDEAARLGITPAQLSARELGRAEAQP